MNASTDPIGCSDERLPLAASMLRAEGRPVVFLHGFAHNRHVWTSLVEGLDAELQPVLVDLRGHGDSPWSPGRHYTTHDYARDLPATFDALELERAIVVGHSLGGLASISFAARHPERVEALVLVDTGPRLSVETLEQINEDVCDTLACFETPAGYTELLVQLMPFAEPEALDAFAARSLVRRLDGRFELKLDPGVMQPDLDEAGWRASQAQLLDAMRKIGCPTLLVRGGRSAVLSEAGANEIVREIGPRARLEVLQAAGHAVMLEDAAGLRRAIERFVASPAHA